MSSDTSLTLLRKLIKNHLDHFPSVSREQAIAALELAKEMLTAYGNPAC